MDRKFLAGTWRELKQFPTCENFGGVTTFLRYL